MGRPRIHPLKPTKAPKCAKVENPRIRSIDSVNIAATLNDDVFIVVDKQSLQMRVAPKSGMSNPGPVAATICNLEQLHELSPDFLKNKVVMRASSYVHIEKLTEVVEVKTISIIDHITS